MMSVAQQKEVMQDFTHPGLLEFCHVLLRRRGDRAREAAAREEQQREGESQRVAIKGKGREALDGVRRGL